MTDTVPIDAALLDENLLGCALGNPVTWRTWIAVLKAAFGRRLTPEERAVFDRVAGGRSPPIKPVRELWVIAGRNSGKSRMAGALSAYTATVLDHAGKLAPGERGMVLTLSASKDQAATVHGYAEAFITASPILRQRVRDVTAEQIRLDGDVIIGTHVNSYRTVRGRTLLACIFDEAAFWRDEASANPDAAVYTAVLPMLLRTGGMLIGISTPYRRVGLLHQKHRDCFGKDDPSILVVQGPTGVFNPTVDAVAIAAARASDPHGAVGEWDAEFRSDLSAFLDDASIDAAIDYARPLELPPRPETVYHAFTDATGGGPDTFTLCVGHLDGGKFVCDVIRGSRAHDLNATAAEFAKLARDYGCRQIWGDNYGKGWVSGAFLAAGMEYMRCPRVRSDLYLDGLPMFLRGQVSIPDHPQLVRELRLLERRSARSGKDTVDHGVGGHDDHANSLFGALHLAARRPEVKLVSPGVWTESGGWISEPRVHRGRASPPAPSQREQFERALMEEAHRSAGGNGLYGNFSASYEKGDV
jgi:hypothetical protein